MIQKHHPIQIQEALERICEHNLFVNSSNYKKLLRYLVKKALKNENLKEHTIGIDIYGENYLIDKSDGIVRSYMYRLRKKLDEYYNLNSEREDVIFKIEKGQYNLSFIDNTKTVDSKKEQENPLKFIQKNAIYTLVFLLIGISSFIGYYIFQNQPHQLWSSFFTSKTSTLVVVSDQYVVSEKLIDGIQHGVLYPEINNDEDLSLYLRNHPGKNIKSTDYSVFSKMAPFGIQYLTEWFVKHNSNFQIKLETELTIDDVQNNHIVFIGQFKTMNLSKSFFLKGSKQFSVFKDGFKHVDNGVEKTYNTQRENRERVEYAMVSSGSIVAGKRFLYFVSNNDIGVMGTLKKFTNKAWLDSFIENVPNPNFNALFEVKGVDRNNLSTQIKHLEIVNNVDSIK